MKYTFLDYFRSRRFFILLTITLLISALLTFIVGYYRPGGFLASDLSFYSGWWGNSVTFVIVLSGVFFGGDAISGEFQNKTGYFGIPNPIRRSSIYIGKWLAAFIAATAILGVFTVITVGNGLYYFGLNVPYQFGLSVLFAWFYLAAVLGFTFFFSSLFKSSSMSILVTIILFLFVFSLIQTLVANLVKIEPWFILTYGAQIIGNILMVPYPPHASVASFGPPGGPTFTTYNVTIPEGLAIIGLYFIITAILGLVLFERKEFT
jgi:ABC-2 type transport system permease protein